MRLFEIIAPTLYVKSRKPLKLGEIVSQPYACALGAAAEGMLERRRPEEQLARENSLTLFASSDLSAEYVYAVQPLGQLDKHHTSWLRKLENCVVGNQGEMEQYAGGYWSDDVIPEDRDAPWEFRAAKARVLKRVGGSAPCIP